MIVKSNISDVAAKNFATLVVAVMAYALHVLSNTLKLREGITFLK